MRSNRTHLAAMLLSAALLISGCGTVASPAAALKVAQAPRVAAVLPTVTVTPVDEAEVQAFQPEVTAFRSVPKTPVTTPSGALGGNAAELFVTPAETAPAIKALIASAETSLYFEAFNFGNSYGEELAPLLAAKAASGVEVKLLLDEVGSRFLKGHRAQAKALVAAGAEIRYYKAKAFSRVDGSPTFNITHRKVYMADGARALVGGVNLMAPFQSSTQDLLIEWRGPVIGAIFTEFQRDWSRAGGGKLGVTPVTAIAGDVEAQVAVTSPFEGRYEIRDAVFAAIDSAKDELLMEHQYFWDEAMIAHVKSAAERGVKVKVIIPGPDQKIVQRSANADQLRGLVKLGVEAHRYSGRGGHDHLHTKYFAVDGRWATTGSCNGDTRSLLDNQELNVHTTSPELVAELRTRLFDRDWNEFSTPFTPGKASAFAKPLLALLDLVDYYL